MMPPFVVFPTKRIAYFVEVSLYFILSSTTSQLMKITRDGKEIELTAEELEEAHAEFVTNFMRMTLETDFGVSPEDSQDLAEQAYDRYCEGNGETEYECIEAVYSESNDLDDGTMIRPAYCGKCYFHVNGHYCEERHEYISEDSCCDHVHSDVVFKVYTCGEFKGYYYIDGFKTQVDALLALCEMFGCGCVDDVRMEATIEE